jgi:hypothetical protein
MNAYLVVLGFVVVEFEEHAPLERDCSSRVHVSRLR